MKLNLSDMKNAQEEFMSQNTPHQYGTVKKGALSNRLNMIGAGNLTSRSLDKGSELRA